MSSFSTATINSPIVVLDASIWVSYLVYTDANHAAASNWMSSYRTRSGTFVAPSLFQLEVASAITRLTKDQQFAAKAAVDIQRLTTHGMLRVIPIEPNILQDANVLAISQGLRAGDALYAALAQKFRIPLVTFDAELLKIPASVTATIKP